VTITGTTGRSAVISDDIGTAINTKHLCCMTLDRNVVEPEFLAHALHCDPDVVHQIEGENRGAIMSGLNMGIIRGLRVQVPPLPVQQKFVTLLNQLRVVEARQQQALQASEALFQSLSQRAFAGELTTTAGLRRAP
jgi:type I restriction enzyme S subunit